MIEIKPCPWCGSNAIVIKMTEKDIPVAYLAKCLNFCDGFADFSVVCSGDTPEEAVSKWNKQEKYI